jgi:hypothetical protein
MIDVILHLLFGMEFKSTLLIILRNLFGNFYFILFAKSYLNIINEPHVGFIYQNY